MNKFSFFLLYAILAIAPLYVSFAYLGADALLGSLLGGALLGVLAWFISPFFGRPLSLLPSFAFFSWLSSVGWFAVLVRRAPALGVAVDIVFIGGRIFLAVWSVWSRYRPAACIHVHRGVLVPLVRSFADGFFVDLDAQVNLDYDMAVQARVPDMRSYPHCIPPSITDGHFRTVSFTIPVPSVLGRLSNVTKHFRVCEEFVSGLLVRAQGQVKPAQWFYEEVNKISPVNLPREVDRDMRMQSAAAAYFEALHEKQLFNRYVSLKEPKIDRSVFMRMGCVLCLRLVAWIPVPFVSLLAKCAMAFVSIAPASYFQAGQC